MSSSEPHASQTRHDALTQLCYARQHGTSHLHTLFHPKDRHSTHDFKQGYSLMPRSHVPTFLFQTYTPKTLAPFDGKDGGRCARIGIFLGLKLTTWPRGYVWQFADRDDPQGMAEQPFELGMFWILLSALHHTASLTQKRWPRSTNLWTGWRTSLRPDEIYVYSPNTYACSDACSSAKT